MLTELVNKDFVMVNLDVWTWEEAVVCVGNLMRLNGCVEDRYIGCMIETTKIMGPYNVIAPGVALAHARPEDGVNQTCVSFTTLKRPVVFGNPEHDPVRLVVGLAAIDDETHLDVITCIAKILSDFSRYVPIFSCRSQEDVVQLIRAIDINGHFMNTA